jgi:hypothetical protein
MYLFLLITTEYIMLDFHHTLLSVLFQIHSKGGAKIPEKKMTSPVQTEESRIDNILPDDKYHIV